MFTLQESSWLWVLWAELEDYDANTQQQHAPTFATFLNLENEMSKREKGKYLYWGFWVFWANLAIWEGTPASFVEHRPPTNISLEGEGNNRFPSFCKSTLYFICLRILLPGACPQSSDLAEQHRGKEAGSLRTEPPGNQDSFKWFMVTLIIAFPSKEIIDQRQFYEIIDKYACLCSIWSRCLERFSWSLF